MNTELKQAVKTYIGTALWASHDCGPDGQDEILFDNYASVYAGPGCVLSFGVIRNAIKDCKAFMQEVIAELGNEPAQAIFTRQGSDIEYVWPHDFWLTRNHHGAGFWDNDWDTVGDILTEISHKFGDVDLYIGDDGRIYQ